MGMARIFPVRILSDRRGVSALEFAIVSSVLVGLLLPISDLIIAFTQYISAYQAVRDLGAYAQYHTSAIDMTTTPWTVPMPTIAGHSITVQVMCGSTSTPCSDTTKSPKWFVFSTTFTLNPVFVTALAAGNPYTVTFSERFQ
jgi:Flp pilus assembly protein TadG